MPEIPGFRIKHGDVEVEFYSQDPITVANEYRKVLDWFQKVIEKKLQDLELQVAQLREDVTELKELQKEA